MATNVGQQAVDLNDRLLNKSDQYSFFQANRLLRFLSKAQGISSANALRIRPSLSLGFPKSDIQSIEVKEGGGYRMSANFLGLYGVDSPLPTFYTEDLLHEESDGLSVNREFLDIVAQSLYPLFFRAWLKPRVSLRVVEYEDARMLDILYAFVGIPEPKQYLNQPGIASLLNCAALYSQQIRSAAGLQAIIEASFVGVVVLIKQLQRVMVQIPQDQTLLLGIQASTLGQTSHLGSECQSMGGVTICLDEVNTDLFRALLPGGIQFERLRFLVDYYLIEPIPVRVELTLKNKHIQSSQLSGKDWGQLGHDTWLLPKSYQKSVKTFFSLPIRKHKAFN
jgi:type VI secretion system protein ImpH